MSASTEPVVLVLENGRVFHGNSVGPVRETFGELVFNTSMSGYQEILSDPSYAGQIVVMTAPHIGNTGVNAEDMEASQVACAGLVMREASPIASNWRSEGSLQSFLIEHQVAGMDGLDTRALTHVLREEGAMRAAISSDVNNIDAVLSRVRSAPEMTGRDLASEVTCSEQRSWEERRWHAPDDAAPDPALAQVAEQAARPLVVVYDFGAKDSILRDLCSHGCRLQIVPAQTPAHDVLALKPDGIFLSNGPGDPETLGFAVKAVAELVKSGLPIFGICLGHQILALALGAKSYKLTFGHHGGNHPVMELSTRKVEITAQNHGFAIDRDSLPSEVVCTHVNLYDNSVEGIEVRGKPIFGVQYHPESSPGPHDARYLFERFARLLESTP